MAIYAVGDVQGCVHALRELLIKIRFSADRDQLWLCGDLVNRGPDSLGTLRAVHDRRDNMRLVLGNHDLHLLAVAHGCAPAKKGDSLDDVLHAPDRDQLLDYLLEQPLVLQDGDWLMSHAGIPPGWTASQALSHSADVSRALQRDPAAFFTTMYGNEPSRWDDSLRGSDRLRFTVNALTRMRFVSLDGRLDLKHKGPPGTQPDGLIPWFRHPDQRCHQQLLFGHWATLNGKADTEGIHALDTGAVYGHYLTALNLDSRERIRVPGWKR